MKGLVVSLKILTALAFLAAVVACIHLASISGRSEMAPVARALSVGFFVLPALMLTCFLFVVSRIASAHLKADLAAPNDGKGDGLGRTLVDFGFRLAILGGFVKFLTSPWRDLAGAPDFLYLVIPALALWASPGLLLALLGYWMRGRG